MLTIHEGILQLIETLKQATLDAQKFDEGNNLAGRRVRKVLAGAMKESKVIRAGVLTIQKKRKL